MMAEPYREHQCPNCGAPLGIPEKHERFFKCQFCGTVLEDQATEEEQETGVFKIKITSEDIAAARQRDVPVYTAPPMTTTYTATDVGRATGRAGCVLTALIALLSLGAVALAFVPGLFASGALSGFLERAGLGDWLEGSPIGEALPQAPPSALGGLRIFSYGVVDLLPSDNDTSPDFVGVANLSDDTKGLLYIDFDSEQPLRWKAEVEEGASFAFNRFLAVDARLVFNYGSTLVAFNRESGARIWEARLSDEIQHNICQDCLSRFGEAILALTRDGVLAAYDRGSGEQLWSARLNETPRQIVNFGGQPAVLDQEGGDPYLQVYDLQSGQPREQIRPACPNDPFPSDPQVPGIYDPVIVSTEGSSLYFIAGFFEPGCVQRWDTAAGEMIWQATFPVEEIRSTEYENLLLTGERLFIVNDHGARSFEISDGASRQLVADEDYNFLPLGERDGVLVVLAERTRGTRRWEIWGVDTELGNVKWKFVPENAERINSFSGTLTGDAGWTAGLTPGGLTLAVIVPDSRTLLLQTIPLQSGTASAPVSVALQESLTGFLVNMAGWHGSRLWLVVGTDLYQVDTASGMVEYLFP